MRKELYRHTLI